MPQEEILYSYSSITITLTLFVLIVLFNEFGFRVGRLVQTRTNDEVKSLTGSLQASILGLLALLLGFTFSMSMQRYNDRSMALIDEANAIGTSLLRTQLLNEKYRNEIDLILKEYVDLRIAIGTIDLTQVEERARYNKQTALLQNKLWNLTISITDEDPRPVTTGAFILSLNDTFDTQSKRNALLQMHVPEVVLLLLFIVFIASVGIIGYSSGLNNRRVVMPTILIAFLISMIVFIIIDLDRPKRGLIQVNQDIMKELR